MMASDWVPLAANFGVAFGTAVLALVTFLSLRHARSTSRAATAQAATATLAMQASVRPWLTPDSVPLLNSGRSEPFTGVLTTFASGRTELVLRFRNVGHGIALVKPKSATLFGYVRGSGVLTRVGTGRLNSPAIAPHDVSDVAFILDSDIAANDLLGAPRFASDCGKFVAQLTYTDVTEGQTVDAKIFVGRSADSEPWLIWRVDYCTHDSLEPFVSLVISDPPLDEAATSWPTSTPVDLWVDESRIARN